MKDCFHHLIWLSLDLSYTTKNEWNVREGKKTGYEQVMKGIKRLLLLFLVITIFHNNLQSFHDKFLKNYFVRIIHYILFHYKLSSILENKCFLHHPCLLPPSSPGSLWSRGTPWLSPSSSHRSWGQYDLWDDGRPPDSWTTLSAWFRKVSRNQSLLQKKTLSRFKHQLHTPLI